MSDVSVADAGLPEVETTAEVAAEVTNEAPAVNDGQEAAETNSVEGAEPKGDEFSKKAKNAIRYRDRKISKAMARIRELEALIPQAKQANEQKLAELRAPNEKEFDGFADYVKADALHLAKKEILAAQQASQTELLTQQHQEAVAQREAEIAEIATDFAAKVADYQQTIAPVLPIIDKLPAPIQGMIRDLDNPVAAIYALAKEGRLESLAYANPHLAAVTILQAQERGESFYGSQNQRPVTNTSKAPEPMRGAKGTATPTKSIESMNARELLKWVGN